MRTRVDETLAEYKSQLEFERLGPSLIRYVGGARATQSEWSERARLALRHAVIMEGANVPCELVRDGGG